VGGGAVPSEFASSYRFRERLVETLRLVVQRYLLQVNLPILMNMIRARLILARTKETISFLPGWARRKAILIPETALNVALFPFNPEQRSAVCFTKTIVIVYAGRILSWKNLHLAIMAFMELLRRYPNLSGRIRFDIYGDGPYMTVCKQLAGPEADRSIFFHGFVNRAILMDRLSTSHLFIHLSVKDTAATAPMEAMALGLPVVCIKHGGMGNLVDTTCGMPLEPSAPSQIIEETILTLRELVDDRERLLRLSLVARQRIERLFTWEYRIDQYNKILQKLLRDSA
jgi:glycosyltransferase involved in cell wall biosynthesis